MTVDYKDKNTLGGGWSLEVLRAGVLVGHIRKPGLYQYFAGPHNELTPSFEDADLEVLKRRVEKAVG